MSAPPFQFPASLPTAVNQPAGQSSVVLSQDKFLNSATLLTGVGEGPFIQGKTHIPSQDSYATNAQALTCLGSTSPPNPPEGGRLPSKDLYVSVGVVINTLLPA